MHQIFTIARFELAKKKVAAKPSAIIGLLVVFLLFMGAFFLLSHVGYKPTHTYYAVTPTRGALDTYVADSGNVKLNPDAAVVIFSRSDGSYVLATDQQFVGMATATAIAQMLKVQNRELLITSGIEPPFLVLLNVTYRLREELLQPIMQTDINTTQTNNITIAGERITRNNSIDVLVPKNGPNGGFGSLNALDSSLQTPSAATPATGGTVLATQQITRTTIVSAADIDVASLRANNSLARVTNNLSTTGVPPGLQYPGDISTLQGVKDLFIIIELMLVFNFFAALLGNSFFEEKLNYRSSLLFSMPLPRRFVVIGKVLPYLLLSMIFACVLLAVQYPHLLLNPIIYILLIVLALIYFSLSFLNGLLARSNKEYSFLNVFTTSILSLYLLIPAFIANYSTLGYASLLTPILFFAQKQPVSISLLFFLIIIYAALAIVIFFLGSALWNFEHLYKYESPLKKLQYMLRTNTKSLWQFFVYGICCVPFLWLAQIIMIAMFLLVPIDNKLFLFLFGAAFCEEFVRTLVIRAHIAYKRASPITISLPLTRLKRSIAIGLGFGLAEKVILFIAIAPYLQGYQYIITTGIIIPIIIHASFTYLFSFLVETNDWLAAHPTLVCIVLGLLHSLFNYSVITFAGVTMF